MRSCRLVIALHLVSKSESISLHLALAGISAIIGSLEGALLKDSGARV